MKKIYIWGAGFYLKIVFDSIDRNQCKVCGIIDKDKRKQGTRWEDSILIESPDMVRETEFDFILISVKKYHDILEECIQMGVRKDKVIAFWKLEDRVPFINDIIKRTVILEDKVGRLQEQILYLHLKIENQPYELGMGKQINVKSAEELLREIIKSKVSLCRFGDGELEMIRGEERLWYQNVDEKLSQRLYEILNSREDNIIIAVANNFGNLDLYTEEAAYGIREYLSNGRRAEIMKLLNTHYVYYDAYVSRPYMMYRDKKHAEIIFELFKEIWKSRNVLVVEGKYTKTGVGNDLFSEANNIRRIICPDTNAFEFYEDIFRVICKNVSVDELVLIALGPTATVLAYDLSKREIQALDIGQLDNEYEWFLHRAKQREKIEGKVVAEIDGCHKPEKVEENSVYINQIVEEIYI